jgi:3,4-dihydroxy 2-butanone 4-phosphate synthase/GTP cyclohydrolase II
MTGQALDRLDIPMMVPAMQNSSTFTTPFTVSVEARTGVTTGISAYDRARTIQVLIDPASTRNDLVMPGHMFPLRAHPRGVLARRGQTEAGVDLTRLAGLTPAAVLCEIMKEDGTMARLPALHQFARKHDIKIIAVEDVVSYRRQYETETSVTRGASAQLPTVFGQFEVTAYLDFQQQEHLVLSMGDIHTLPPLIRLHSECLTGDALGSIRCDCREQLQLALKRIADEGQGLLIYLRQEGRGIGLANKIRAYNLQDHGMDTVEANHCLGFPADQRTYAVAAAILRDQDISTVRLMTNNPDKIAGLEANAIQVIERIPHQVAAKPENRRYLQIKAQKLDHLLNTKQSIYQR